MASDGASDAMRPGRGAEATVSPEATGSGVNGLVVEDLTCGYGKHDVIRGMSFGPLEPGELTVLVGPNAAGKSTLLRALAGLVRATGSVALDGGELLELPPGQRAQRVAFMPQGLPENVDLSVLEGVISALLAGPGERPPGAEVLQRALGALQRLGIGTLAMESLDRLSGGQRQLASLAQALVREPRLLLLDEPTSALDLRYQVVVMQIAREVAREGRVVVAVLHDLTLAARWADHVILLGDGRIEAVGSPAEAFTPELIGAVYGVRSRVERCSQGRLQVIVDGASAEEGT